MTPLGNFCSPSKFRRHRARVLVRRRGQVANPNTNIFMISKGTTKGAAAFIFGTLDGTISGWNPNVDMNNAIIAVRKAGDVFTCLAIATVGSHTFLYAADAAHNKIDVFDSNFKLVSSFTDGNTPAGLAVYGIQTIHGNIYITLGAFGSTASITRRPKC